MKFRIRSKREDVIKFFSNMEEKINREKYGIFDLPKKSRITKTLSSIERDFHDFNFFFDPKKRKVIIKSPAKIQFSNRVLKLIK